MPQPDRTIPGAPCWTDLYTSDVERAKSFYGALFGWTVNDSNAEQFGGYFTFEKDGQTVAGGMVSDGQSGPDTWSIYLVTDDVKAAAAASSDQGGQTVIEPMQVADLGSMAVFTDSGGAAIGAWQPDTMKGFDVFMEPGTPGWFELLTRDFTTSVAYYENVFKWTTKLVSDTDEFRYATLAEGETMYAGIMDASAFLPEGVPAAWSIYFAVDDVDAVLAKVVELGGTVVENAEDTPYGRLARAADLTGTQFKLVGPNLETSAD